jgi:hypothetical protein
VRGEILQQVLDVRLDRLRADREVLGDLALAFGEEAEDLLFARRQAWRCP